jgi:hypothetical protein
MTCLPIDSHKSVTVVVIANSITRVIHTLVGMLCHSLLQRHLRSMYGLRVQLLLCLVVFTVENVLELCLYIDQFLICMQTFMVRCHLSKDCFIFTRQGGVSDTVAVS